MDYPLPTNLAGVFPGIKVHNGFLQAILDVTAEAKSPENNLGAIIANLSGNVTPQTVSAKASILLGVSAINIHWTRVCPLMDWHSQLHDWARSIRYPSP